MQNRKTKILTALVITACLVFSATTYSQVIVPTVANETNINAYGGTGTTELIDNSGMTPAVNTGDSLATTLAAVHVYGGGFSESYVSNASGTDYFAGGTPPRQLSGI